ncbi:SNARE-complex protein Syntaxin-18 N-terminal [Penicillium hispanicum]|uniref:SNARE-complex protein Syntaxin-18 N-terminal n=1 Tax=Penicillium hispanicum TaxID=1080232 RepID=UPI002540F933|nr:SNARE-complex protein Syntaxin-18 N-terminal [Penicillium hispanicum]KAJ5569809.1 SNARE-complex protein Syntaxin-18 N-terminal [Penicillium hispanicum]
MTDLTPTINQLLSAQNVSVTRPETRQPSTETADEFLKEAYRINSHIHSLLQYLQSIRHAYLSTTAPSQRRDASTGHARKASQSLSTPRQPPSKTQSHLTDPERDAVDSSTALLLRDLAASISNLASAESLRQETEATVLRKKYGHSAAGAILWRWAGGEDGDESTSGKSADQVRAEESARTICTVREGVLWFLRRGLEGAASVQRGMVEKRIERVREKEKSVLYKAAGAHGAGTAVPGGSGRGFNEAYGGGSSGAVKPTSSPPLPTPDVAVLSEADTAQIEAQLSPEQLQLFAEENDSMLRHYEDTLGKVQNAEKSLLEISSLQETLVSHLSTQEEYITQLVSDADTTQTNVGRGNRELKRATERKSTAQAVFWGTVGLCTGLVVWDLIF